MFTTNWFQGRRDKIAETTAKFKGIGKVLEIGCWEGQATVWFAQNFKKVETIDPFTGNPEHIKKFDLPTLEGSYRENILGLDNITTHKGTSKDILPTLGMFDVIYVDGSHAAYDVIYDAVVGWEHLQKGGVMIFDDYEWGGELSDTERPKIAIDAFLNIYKGQYNLLYKKGYVIIEKCGSQKPTTVT